MNVLSLLFSFTTGGTERLVTDICNELSDRGHTVHLYIVNDLYQDSMLSCLHEKIQVHLQKRVVGGGDKLKTLLAVARYIKAHKIDVVHCNSFAAPELLLLKPLYFPKTRVLYTVHGLQQYSSLSKGKCVFRNWLCHRLIAVSNSVKQEMLDCGADPDKVVTIYNAIDLRRFTPVEAPDGDFVIGNVARIMPETKGQDILVEAMGLLHQQYPSLRCVFAGAADSFHQESLTLLQNRVRELGLSDAVSFLGNVTDVPGFLSKAHIFVLPSRSEGFGISLVEAMAMGLPCIASRLDGPVEVLENGKLGKLFRPEDPEDLAEKIRETIAGYEIYKAAAMEHIDHVKALYDIKRMCDQLEQIMR